MRRPDGSPLHEPGTCDACEGLRRDRLIVSAQLEVMAVEPPAQTGYAQRYADGSTVAAAPQQESVGLSTG